MNLGVGLDFNTKCVNAANALKAANRVSNIHFFTFDLDKEDLSLLSSFVLDRPVDICCVLNIAIWVKRWKEVVVACRTMASTLLFEAHGSPDQQAAQISFVESLYEDCTLLSAASDDDPTYSKRTMYLCQNAGTTGEIPPPAAEGDLQFLQSDNQDAALAGYASAITDEVVESFTVRAHSESVVAEINGNMIAKFPRPSRGIAGIQCEQKATDLIRSKVEVDVPQSTIYQHPIVFSRYRRLAGVQFDRTVYDPLSVSRKDSLAKDIAEFLAAMHNVSDQDLKDVDFAEASSWSVSCGRIEKQLGSVDHRVIKTLLKNTITTHRQLEVSIEDQVFGHFDLHGSNILLSDDHRTLTGVLDFGNCKTGDLHEELAVMHLSSSDLADRVATQYVKLTGRNVRSELIEHHSAIRFLNILADLKAGGQQSRYDYWLAAFEDWYAHSVERRARKRVAEAGEPQFVSDRWRQWLATNLLKGRPETSLRKAMQKRELEDLDIESEILVARSHPYLLAAQEIATTLAKRDWLMATVDALSAIDPRYGQSLDRQESLPFEVFLRDYYSKQLPVVITGGVEHWQARKEWTPEYLGSRYGEIEIEVQHNRDNDPLYERNAGKHKTRMQMSEFVSKVVIAGKSNDSYMTANNTKGSLSSGLRELFEDIGDFGPGYTDTKRKEGGTFLWFGPEGIVTPLHHDLTNNMLIQIYGHKRVTLIPAFQVPMVYNDVGVFSSASFPDHDTNQFPLLSNARPLEITIGLGESLFIPVGWWHRVVGLDPSISVSFTNFQAPNGFFKDYPRPS